MEPGARDRPARGGDRASGHSTFHECPARFHGSKEQAGERYAVGHFALYGEAARGREQSRRRRRGNNHTLTPTSKGKLPKFQWTQFTPPQAKIQNLNPKLAMDPSLLGPPDLKVASPNMANFGDPLAKNVTDSLGNGNGTGIGSGSGGGLGPGEGGGTGGGTFRAGLNGVGSPMCIYCPQPEYSDEARKGKYQGTVLLDVTVTADGRVLNPQVLKGPGLGLEEKAMAQVKNWKMRPR